MLLYTRPISSHSVYLGYVLLSSYVRLSTSQASQQPTSNTTYTDGHMADTSPTPDPQNASPTPAPQNISTTPAPPLKETNWFPAHVLNGTNVPLTFGVIILNRPVHVAPATVTALWKKARIRATVDKGTDRWLAFLKKNQFEHDLYKPDIVTGDFDSVKKGSVAYFRKLGSDIIPTPDQTHTDFQKAVNECKNRARIDYIVALCETNGRLDHLMSNINTLYKSDIPIYLLSGRYLSWVMRADGSIHKVHLPEELTTGKKIVGLLPVGHPVHGVYSSGLKWDLKNHTLEVGGLVSSSNSYARPGIKEVNVTIGHGGDLFYTMSTPKRVAHKYTSETGESGSTSS